MIFTLEKKIDIRKRGNEASKPEEAKRASPRKRSDQARGSEATEGGRVCHGRDFLHFGTLNCAILCIPEGEIWA